MGKKFSKSNHNKENQSLYSRSMDVIYDNIILKEIKRIKRHIDKEKSPLLYEYKFGFVDYKKQMSRILKWNKIINQSIVKENTSNMSKKKRNYINVSKLFTIINIIIYPALD